MIFTFKLSAPNREIDREQAIKLLLENLLSFLTIVDDDGDVLVDSVNVNGKTLPLFENPLEVLWADVDGDDTTKKQLRTVRKNENPDEYYDLDVLKKTEPRIEFIFNALGLINCLSTNERKRILEHAKPFPGDESIKIDLIFQRYLTSVSSYFNFFASDHEVVPAAFRFHNSSKNISLSDKSENVISGFCPFIEFIKLFSPLIAAKTENQQVSEFALSSYDHWLEPSDGQPFEILSVLSRDCNAKCDFCYVLGNPSNTTIKLVKFSNERSEIEARDRLRFFKQGKRLPQPTYDTEEITTHPAFFDLCKEIREVSDKCISITTNGYMLSEKNILKLKELSPVDVSLSLNSSNLSVRKWLMKGNYRKGLEALELMHKHQIPCVATVVAWPKVELDEMKETIQFADQFNLRSISVLLGGYTRFFPDQIPYSIPEYWDQVIDELAPLREQISTPLILQPRLYEEQKRFKQLGKSIITGIIKYSPAFYSTLKIYDEIIAIDDNNVITRNQCLSQLSLARERQSSIALTVKRNDEILKVKIDSHQNSDDNYIYGFPFNDRFGIHLMADDIKVSSIRQIFKLVNQHNASNVLFLTSRIVRPFLQKALQDYGFLIEREVEFDLEIPPNSFFGGNIIMGDMLVLDDFLYFLREYLPKNPQIDLVIIPSGAFNYGGWFRDLKGQPFELLKRSFKIPVEILIAQYFE